MKALTKFRMALASMFLVAQATRAQDLDPQHVGSWPSYSRGPASAVAVSGDYAYVAAGSLQVIEVSDPVQPRRIGHYDTQFGSGRITDVAISGHYAYVAHEAGLDVIDISNPALPRRVGGEHSLNLIEHLAVAAGRAYLSGEHGVQIVDISDPSQPQLSGRIQTSGVTQAAVAGEFAYIAEQEEPKTV